MFLGCDMPIQLLQSSEYDDHDSLEDCFIMYGFTSWTTKQTFMLEQIDLHIFYL